MKPVERIYGVDVPIQSPEIYSKAVATYRETCQSKYGVSNAMKVQSIALKALVRAGGFGLPNLFERRFSSANPELVYTGNGTFWKWLPKLGHHKNPDFILPGPNHKHPHRGVTKVVELFGDFWHSRMFTGKANFEHESELVAAFEEIGIECLVVWESEVKKSPRETQERVHSFLEST